MEYILVQKVSLILYHCRRVIKIWRIIHKMKHKEYLLLKKLIQCQCIVCANFIRHQHYGSQDTCNFFPIYFSGTLIRATATRLFLYA